ncbi:MAG: OB-fold domain-containing protein [Thermodesulfobacteriota bacterium]|nr:OB-fold domain-containing protein [Thermodesulfobacteriota bacterium]
MEERPFSDISYNTFLKEEKLMGSECKKCENISVPPRSICRKCFSKDMKWIELKGKGKIAAFTCITVVPPRMEKEGYGRKNPYCSGVVELEGGLKTVARIEGFDCTKPETIHIGAPVTVTFLNEGKEEEKSTVLAFKPLAS